jgi:transcription elongation factor GreA
MEASRAVGFRFMGELLLQEDTTLVKREPEWPAGRAARTRQPTLAMSVELARRELRDRRSLPGRRVVDQPAEALEVPATLGFVEGTHLSTRAHQRLQDELAWRTGAHRQEISHWLERAREHGDIRENADYDAAKNEQGHNEARIRQLEALLREAVIVDDAAGDVVAPGVVVEIRMDGDNEPIEYLVGSIEERHDTYDVLSVLSPLGQALLGTEVGAVVTYDGPRRTMSVEIVGIRTP